MLFTEGTTQESDSWNAVSQGKWGKRSTSKSRGNSPNVMVHVPCFSLWKMVKLGCIPPFFPETPMESEDFEPKQNWESSCRYLVWSNVRSSLGTPTASMPMGGAGALVWTLLWSKWLTNIHQKKRTCGTYSVWKSNVAGKVLVWRG